MKVDRDYLFAAFRLWWAELMGSERPIQQEDRIDEWLVVDDRLDDVDFADVLFRLEKHLGVQIAISEFAKHFGTECESPAIWERCFAQQFTFDRFVELIADKNSDPAKFDRAYTPVSFAPVSIAGKPCAPAGAFFGIQALVSNINPHARRFGPSSPIAEFVKGRSRNRFWRRIRVEIGDSIPPLTPVSQRWWVRVAFAAWYVGGAIIVGILVSHFTAPPDLPEQLLGVFAVVHGLIILAAAIFIDDLCGGFLPEQILTFRDLSNCIATANTHLTKTDN